MMRKVCGIVFLAALVLLILAHNIPGIDSPFALIVVAIVADVSLIAGAPLFDRVSLGMGAFVLAGALSMIVADVIPHVVIMTVQLAWLAYWYTKVHKAKETENTRYGLAMLAVANVTCFVSLLVP